MIGSDWLTVWQLQNSLWGKRPKTEPWHGQCPLGRVWDSRGGNHLSPHRWAGGWKGSRTFNPHGPTHPQSFSTTLCSAPRCGLLGETLAVGSRAEQWRLNPPIRSRGGVERVPRNLETQRVRKAAAG